MSSHSILLPSKPKIIKEADNKGVYEIDGLYPGYGHTLGNSLRRIILSSIPGAAITAVSIDGVKHEFSTIDGVKEDVVSILLNLKKVRFSITTNEAFNATIKVKGAKIVTAADIVTPTQLTISNMDQYICELTDKSSSIDVEITVQKGLGFVPREELTKEKAEIGKIYLDASFTPVRRASYEVENMRVGDKTDHNRLRMMIETDGTVTPKDVLEQSIETMIKQLQAIVGFREQVVAGTPKLDDVVAEPASDEMDFSKIKVEDLEGLSTRTINALHDNSVKSVAGLVKKTSEDLISMDGLGEKSVEEIVSALANLGLTLK